MRVCDQPLENGLGFPFLETDPLQFGHFFNEPLHFLVVFHAAADALAPGFGNTVLTIFSVMALNQIQGLVQFAPGAAAVRLAALAGPA